MNKRHSRAQQRFRLNAAEFQGLANVPSAAEWFANLDNPRTRRIYLDTSGHYLASEKA